jgi:anaerobic selenocysteine-containing dehydrogenase/Fe-S-cluster-containing dehydrogenase component
MSDKPATSGVRRREFLKVLGAAGATTAAIGCSTEDVGKLIPYLVHPDQTQPGVSNYYATTCRECSASCGILAETRDGRAFKLEGNPAHPLNRGALCARGQAAVQGLLNPDRWRGPMVRRQPGGELEPVAWDEALSVLHQNLSQVRLAGRAGQALFINKHETGAFPVFLDQWLEAMGLPSHLSVDPLADDAVIEANRQVYGTAWPAFNFAAARLIVSFSADFLDAWGATVPQQLAFADARAQVENAPRFVYVGPRRSLTGLNADEWIPCRPGHELVVAQALQGGNASQIAQAAQQSGAPVDALNRLAAELQATRPAVVLAGGGGAAAYALAMHTATWNQQLGAVGSIVRADQASLAYEGMTPGSELVAAVMRMSLGEVPFVAVRGANPAFTLPAPANFAEAFARVPFKVSFSSYPDETSMMCDLVLPDHHPLESWGVAQAMPGVLSVQQPAMDPVFQTRQSADVLIDIARRDPALAPQYAQTLTFREWMFQRFPGGMDGFTAAAPTGIASGTLSRPTPATGPGAAPVPPAAPPADGEFYFLVYPSPVLGSDGGNKPWLQELADPVTKIAWQSWVEVSPRTAVRMGIENGDILQVETAGGRVEAPAYIYPGIQENTVAMASGRGHTAYSERFAANIGVNPMVAVDARSGAQAWMVSTARVSRTGRHTPLVTTEGSPRQRDRGIGQATTVAALLAAPAADPHHPTPTLPGEPGLEGQHDQPEPAGHGAGQRFGPGLRAPVAADAQGGLVDPNAHRQGMYRFDHPAGMANRRWAMTIDLARCTGCSACIVACYAENNIPTVGAPYQTRNTPGTLGTAGGNIVRGREMTWIRLERYWEGPADGSADFEARFVPMLCQHCGNAPCEPVCPVYATYHAPDGLNVQVYNRCVGTRYCSNNCPYKVRYFNWFGYGEPNRPQYAWPEPMHWQLNPDVTVRGKGVMEKCTFCVQRIREAENRAALEGREVQPDEFTVACAQACPSRAIVFGDAADDDWTVAQLAHDRRAYHVFEELNTYSAVVYLRKVQHLAPGAPAPATVQGGAH